MEGKNESDVQAFDRRLLGPDGQRRDLLQQVSEQGDLAQIGKGQTG